MMMDGYEEGDEGGKAVRFPSPRSFWVPLVAATLAAVVFSVVLARGQAELSELKAREAALRPELRALQLRHAALWDERRWLLSEPAAIERVAREEYGFAAPGEISLSFEREPAPPVIVGSIPCPEAWWERLLGRGGYLLVMPAGVFLLSVVVLGILEGFSALRRGRVVDA